MTAYLIIYHPRLNRILAEIKPGNLSLPTFEIHGWVARAVPHINACVEKAYGLCTTVLRHVHESSFHVVLLEVQLGDSIPPNVRWLPVEEANTADPRPELKCVLDEVFTGDPLTAAQIPWEHVGWFERASTWIDEALEAVGRHRIGPIEQRKAAWGWSTILQVPTSEGPTYFKAEYSSPPAEGDVIGLLARKFEARVPRMLAYDKACGWILMDDFGQALLSQSHKNCLQDAVEMFAEIQSAESQNLSRWQQIRTPTVGSSALKKHANMLLGDADYSKHSANEIERCGEILDKALDRIRESSVPASVVNQDFRPGNVVVTPGGDLTFFDWGNTVIAHPFFSFLMFHRHCSHEAAHSLPPLGEHYLKPWFHCGSEEQLRQDLEFARILEPIFVSLWELRETKLLDSSSPWCRHLSEGILSQRGDRKASPIDQVIHASEKFTRLASDCS